MLRGRIAVKKRNTQTNKKNNKKKIIQLLEKQRGNENKRLTPLEAFWILLPKSKICQTYHCFTGVKLEV